MKKSIIVGLGLAALATSAFAADLPSRRRAPSPAPVVYAAAPIFTWAGPYIGVNLGAAINASSFGGGNLNSGVKTKGAGVVAGATVGYNWQAGRNLVLGVEADGSFRSALGGGANSFLWASNTSSGYFATLRARLGFLPTDRLMVYATGGLAVSNVLAPRSFATAWTSTLSGVRSGNDSTTLAGWTVGAGLEYALNQNWSMKGEYLYAQFPNRDARYMTNASFWPVGVRTKSAEHVVRAGVNYRFNLLNPGPVAARY